MSSTKDLLAQELLLDQIGLVLIQKNIIIKMIDLIIHLTLKEKMFWGVKQAPTINSREISRYDENESDIEFIASDSEPIEYNLSSDEGELSSSEEEVTDSE